MPLACLFSSFFKKRKKNEGIAFFTSLFLLEKKKKKKKKKESYNLWRAGSPVAVRIYNLELSLWVLTNVQKILLLQQQQ